MLFDQHPIHPEDVPLLMGISAFLGFYFRNFLAFIKKWIKRIKGGE